MKHPGIDTYILKVAPFARPVLEYLRGVVHANCSEVTETIKWGFPHFEYNKKILCSMAAFKVHCSFGFWNAKDMDDPENILEDVGKTSMGHLGRITSIEDLPSPEILSRYIRHAMEINTNAFKVEKTKTPAPTASKTLVIPDDLREELARNENAAATFSNFSYSNKKDYVDWITEAKTEDTRKKRLLQAIEWMAEGKIRNWKYVRK
jgi:uncharacterized protein YdeI (YjbR/CyaY-like superfamily)